jgi:hypothetical protein
MLHQVIAIGYIYAVRGNGNAAAIRKDELKVIRGARGFGNFLGNIHSIDLFNISGHFKG